MTSQRRSVLRVGAAKSSEAGVIARDPMDTLIRPTKRPPRWAKLTRAEDIECFAARLPAPYDDAFRVGCGTGLEPQVVLDLTLDELDLPRYEIIGLGTKSKTPERRVELCGTADGAAERLAKAARAANRVQLFPEVDALGGKVTLHRMDKIFARVRAAFAAAGDKRFVGIVPYSARHTFCVMNLQGGATVQEVSEQLGLADATMINATYGLYIPKSGRLREATAKATELNK